VALSEAGPQIYTMTCPNSEQETFSLVDGYPQFPGAEIATFSPIDGKMLAVVEHNGIHVIDIENKLEIKYIEKKSVIALEWSPKANYLISC
jgi:hypothetical protein